MKIIILGAGPTGIGAAYQLFKNSHENWLVFERGNTIGGLAASFKDDNSFTWDIGGHVLFSHYPYFDKAVEDGLKGEYYEHLRESWIRILNTWVPYPFQNNIRYLPSSALTECLDGLRNLSSNPAESVNFREWMDAVFGDGIVKYFMKPYNEKVWGIPLDAMSKEWISERVSVVNLERIQKNIAEMKDDVNWGPNNKFKFPQKGGTGRIFESIAAPFKDKIKFGHEMVRIDLKKKEIVFANERRESYDRLINTTPVDLFVEKCGSAPQGVQMAAKSLVHNGGLIVGLGFSRQNEDKKCWMYFPESYAPFYRVTNFHNYSPYNVPDGDIARYFSLMCETTYSDHRVISKNEIVAHTINGLIKSGMIEQRDKESIISKYVIDIPYSYPVPTISRDRALSVIQPFLESNHIYSRGRFGSWKYEIGNMDHSFMQGVEVINRILHGSNELTVQIKII